MCVSHTTAAYVPSLWDLWWHPASQKLPHCKATTQTAPTTAKNNHQLWQICQDAWWTSIVREKWNWKLL